MKIYICAVGKAGKDNPDTSIFQKYAKMLKWQLELKEVQEKRKLPSEVLIEKEAELLLLVIPPKAKVVVLDERGAIISSEDLADKFKKFSNEGFSSVAFVIGGADGLSKKIIEKADFVLSFGKMVFPHMLIRLMLVEQIYRAQTIIDGHPYHRA